MLSGGLPGIELLRTRLLTITAKPGEVGKDLRPDLTPRLAEVLPYLPFPRAGSPGQLAATAGCLPSQFLHCAGVC